MAAIVATLVDAFFKHRQRRLHAHFTQDDTSSGDGPTH